MKAAYYFQHLTNLGEISYRRPSVGDLPPSAIINEVC